MSKLYTADRVNGEAQVRIIHPDGTTPLPHHPYHSPDGHEWGYGGSGPTELAKDLLWDVLGTAPPPMLYFRFRDACVARAPQASWDITEGAIRRWLAEVAAP